MAGRTTIYRYLTGPDDAAFCRRVTEALRAGWILYGHPTLTYDPRHERVICGQAITKEVDAESYEATRDLSSY